jgi:peptidyl-tRNA hydrolase, PTH1 family
LQKLFDEEADLEKTVCVVGLGNPGKRYVSTRHNVGFNVVASLSQSQHSRMIDGNGDYLYSDCMVENRRLILAAPMTFMNESGVAVAQIMEQFKVAPSELLIILDDFQLPFGTLRIRAEGSDGGHNGLASIIYHLQTETIARLRIGIAGPTCPTEERKDLMADYVLSPFDNEEAPQAAEMVTHARDAVLALVRHGIEFAMNNFNRSFLESDGSV